MRRGRVGRDWKAVGKSEELYVDLDSISTPELNEAIYKPSANVLLRAWTDRTMLRLLH